MLRIWCFSNSAELEHSNSFMRNEFFFQTGFTSTSEDWSEYIMHTGKVWSASMENLNLEHKDPVWKTLILNQGTNIENSCSKLINSYVTMLILC